jgi:hypothetical protein
VSGDLIEQYLTGLRARLRTPDAALVLAEAEDHLRETAAAGLAIGMSEREAQEAAISAFGSIRAVARAHRVRYGKAVLAENVVMAALKLGWIFLYWMKDNPGAHTCAQASMLEGSGDIGVQRDSAYLPAERSLPHGAPCSPMWEARAEDRQGSADPERGRAWLGRSGQLGEASRNRRLEQCQVRRGRHEPGEGRLVGPPAAEPRDDLDREVARRIDPQRGRRARPREL